MVRLCGLAGISGGTLTVVLAVLTPSRPRGRVGDECAVRTMREAGVLDAALFHLAGSFVAAALAGLVARAQRTGRLGRSGRAGLAAVAAGATLVASGMALDVWDSGLVPAFIIPGFLAVIAGFCSWVLPLWGRGRCSSSGRSRCLGSTTRIGRRWWRYRLGSRGWWRDTRSGRASRPNGPRA